MSKPKRLRSIRTRIASSFMLVLLLVFFVIFLSFNLVVNNYIREQTSYQLGKAMNNVNRDVLRPGGNRSIPSGRSTEIVDFMQEINMITRKATFLSQVQAMVISEEYKIIAPNNGDSEIINILQVIKQQGKVDGGVLLAEAHGRTLFYIVQPLELKDADAKLRLLLFLDMTDVKLLSLTINKMLLFIILVTGLFAIAMTILVSDRIVQPIRALSKFAEAIGQGDFSQQNLSIRDRELMDLEDAMNDSAKRLENYDRDQKTFFQNASHELRTPLMSIKGYAEGIEVGVFEDNAKAAGIIVSSTDQLTNMVEDLLYISKLDNITETQALIECDLRELLSNCGESVKGLALHEGKHIVYNFPEDEVLLHCNEKNLKRAFGNIISNGLRYAEESVCIQCSIQGNQVVVRIKDDGLGIAPEDIAHIYSRFYKGKAGKHGIGLSIAQTVIQSHGGSIVANNLVDGCEFVITFEIN